MVRVKKTEATALISIKKNAVAITTVNNGNNINLWFHMGHEHQSPGESPGLLAAQSQIYCILHRKMPKNVDMVHLSGNQAD